MTKRWRWGFLICAFAFPACLFGQTSTNAGGRIQFAETVFDFGKIKAGDIAKHTFVFTNAGPEVLQVNHVQPSCGCTATADWTRMVEPGQTGSIPVQFNSGNFSGQIVKTISVTSTDKSQPTTVLQIKGNIWRPVDVSPQYAIINVPPDAEGGSVTVTIVNNTDEQISFSEPQVNNRAFKASIMPGTNGPKEFKMVISTIPPLPGGNVQGQVTVNTTSTNAPVITVNAWANVQPALVVLPAQMTLPAPPISSPITPSVLIQNNSTNALKITEPSLNIEGVGIDVRETQPGRQFSVALTFPAGFELNPGRQVVFTAKSSHPSLPEIRVPISQMSRPVTLPPAAPPQVGAGQTSPPSAVMAQPHQLPAVPAQ